MKYTIHFHPYANQSAEIKIPNKIKKAAEIREYINEHWDKIKFHEPDLDYCGTDFEIYDENDNDIDEEEFEDIVQESGDYRVILTYAGEGYDGSYDKNDPSDEPLYRADVYIKENGEWNFAASCCTECSANEDEEEKVDFAYKILAAIDGKQNYRDIERALSDVVYG